MAKNSFGKQIKSVRKAKGLTQAQLAEKIGRSEKHISKIETGVYFPNYSTLNKILQVLDIKIENIEQEIDNIKGISKPHCYTKLLQILNSATEKELEYYYSLIKQAQKWTKNHKK